MAIDSLAWQLLIPNLNATTIIGVLLIALAIFGGPIFRLLGKLLSTISGGKLGDNVIVSLLIVSGIVLIWGVSIAQDLLKELWENKLLLGIVGIIVFLIVVILILSPKKGKPEPVGKLRL